MKKPNPRLVYDITISTGVLAVSGAAWLQWGVPAGLASFGALVIALTIYAAERLAGR